MSDIFTSPSGVHEHQTDIKSGLVNKDKSAYTQSSRRTFKFKQLKKEYIEPGYNAAASDEFKSFLGTASVYVTDELVGKKVTKVWENDRKTASVSVTDDLAGKKVTKVWENDRKTASVSVTDDLAGKKVTKVWENDKKTASVSVTDDLANKKTAYTRHKRRLSKARGKFSTAVQTVSSNADRAFKTVGAVTSGTDFLATTECYQKDTGESSVEVIEKGTRSVTSNLEKLAVKSSKSRYFKTAAKASDSVKSGKNPGRFVKAVSSSKKAFAKGINAVDSVVFNPLIRIAGDDIGSQAVVKTVEVARYSTQAVKVAARTTKATVKTTGKAVRYTAQTTKKAAKTAQKGAKVASKAAQVTARATASAAKTVAATVSKIIALIAANPVAALIIAAVILILILIIMLCSSIMSTGSISSYGGTGDNQATVSLNDYSAVYDYANKAIATRCQELFNIHNTATGYLRYEYCYEIENEDGTVTTTNNYPIADIAPIMAYLAVNYQNYTLTNNIKNEIDNLVKQLYTYTWKVDPYSYSINHGSGNIETISGSRLTLIIRYHNAARYFEQNNILPQEKMAVYNSIKSYGDMSYFRMYNILKDKNWHEWIDSQYGYGLKGELVNTQYADVIEYSLVQQDYISLSYKNSNNEVIDKIYSPLNGKVTSITENDDYDVILTIKDSENNLEFTIMAIFEDSFSPTVSIGSTVTAGQLIANNSYAIDFKCKANGENINPLLLMEYYPHS